MRIDVHTHHLPLKYQQRLEELPSIDVSSKGGTTILHYAGRSIPLTGGLTDVGARFEWMDEHGIDHTVVSVSTPSPNQEPFSADESVDNVRAINNGYAELKDEHADRITPLGSLPLRDPAAAVAEVDRIHDTLGLAGVALPTAVNGVPLSTPSLEPVFDRIDRLDIPVFLHPTTNAISSTLDDREASINPLAVFPSETTIQLCRMIFDGFFDRHRFDLVLPHMGGTIPFLVGRFEIGRELVGEERAPEKPIEEYLESFYYDVISFHPPAIEATIETVGASRLLFGTDYPFKIENAAKTVASFERAVPDESDREAIYGTTAADVFGI